MKSSILNVGGLCLWGNKCQMNKSYDSAGLFYKRIYKKGWFNTLNLWAILQAHRDLREPDKWLKMRLRISQNPWNPAAAAAAAACWLRTCTVSPRALRIAVHQLPSCPHSPGLTQSGLRAKADRLLEGELAPIWNITGSEVQLQPAPVPVLSHVKWPGFFFEVFDGGTETHTKTNRD